jgi:hypothetical protein
MITMNLRSHGKGTCTSVFVAVKTHRSGVVLAALGALAGFGCHNTWQGVKQDTHHAVQGTGRGLEKAGKKMEGNDDEKKPSNPPAKKGGAPSSGH